MSDTILDFRANSDPSHRHMRGTGKLFDSDGNEIRKPIRQANLDTGECLELVRRNEDGRAVINWETNEVVEIATQYKAPLRYVPDELPQP